MLRHLNKINALEIKVGIVEKQTHDGGIDMAYLYQIHEEGLGNSPARSTLRPAMKQANYKPIAKDIIRGAVTGQYLDAMREGGDQLKKAVRLEVMKIKSPALSPMTIRQRKRGGTNPLVDTGEFLKAIGSKVE